MESGPEKARGRREIDRSLDYKPCKRLLIRRLYETDALFSVLLFLDIFPSGDIRAFDWKLADKSRELEVGIVHDRNVIPVYMTGMHKPAAYGAQRSVVFTATPEACYSALASPRMNHEPGACGD